MAHHQEQDYQSLMLHTAAIKLMRQDEELIERDWDLALSKSERGNQLRQASPVACILPDKQRLEIIKACRAETRPAGVLDSTWGKQIVANMDRMAVDEEYRKLVAKKILLKSKT